MPNSKPTKIEKFFGEHRFLSNFWPATITYDSITYNSVEQGYVANKTLDPVLQCEIAEMTDPGKIKAFGRKIKIREDWEHQHYFQPPGVDWLGNPYKTVLCSTKWLVMNDLVRLKFQIPELREKLMATDNMHLIEGNTWGDTYWGVDKRKGGINNLGYILMDIRYGYRIGKEYSRGEIKPHRQPPEEGR